MKSRHVRAVAVFGLAVFALTGARGSSGGSCSGGSSSSSSSSSGGSDSTSDGTTTSGSSGGSSSSRRAANDLKIESCTYDNGLAARVRATNSSSTTTYSYQFDVEFTDVDGKHVYTTDGGNITAVPAGSSGALNVKVDAGSVDDSAFAASGGTCELTGVERHAA
ncbi:hypothetical protein [Streptomyces adelaidensis]|uniref:hypothetical protein n=1 Tax=Streptomyces adelaidensis TaxID=2796465 RepID=UPI0019078F92|nr:hypothetical protein [Streptomyces adelaidensis]